MGGGLLIDGGIHYLHLLRAWVGPVEEVMAMAPPSVFAGLEGEDTVFLLLRFRSGAVATLANSVAAPGLPRWQWTWVTGTEGSLGIDHRGRALWLRGRSGAARCVCSCATGGAWWRSWPSSSRRCARVGRPRCLPSPRGPISSWCWRRIALWRRAGRWRPPRSSADADAGARPTVKPDSAAAA